MKMRSEKGRMKEKEKETVIDPTIMLLETLLTNIQDRNLCFTNSTLLCSSPSYECSVHTLLVLLRAINLSSLLHGPLDHLV